MTSRLIIGLIVSVLIGSVSSTVSAASDPTNFLFRKLSFSSAENDQLFRKTIEEVDALEFEEAGANSNSLVTNVEADNRIDGLTFARVLANAAIIYAQLEQPKSALELINRSVSLVEEESVFHEDIYPLMMVKAQILIKQGELAEAIDQLRRAQHITHRYGGVYSEQQSDVVDHIADINTTLQNHLEADRQQLFNLRISENVLGTDSIELVPRLEKIGAYFRGRGVALPYASSDNFSQTPSLDRKDRADIFSQAIRHYNRALTIQESAYGPSDIRLVNTLRSLAKTRMAQLSGRRYAEDILERVVEIISSNPVADIPEHAVSLINLGDTYTINGNRNASETYLKAWDLLSQTPKLTNLRESIFSSVTRISPTIPPYNTIARRPSKTQEGEEIFIKATFSVRPNGRVSDINLIEGNAPVEQKKLIRLWLRTSKFRPRIEEREFVLTEGLTTYQTFQVLEKEPVDNPEEPSPSPATLPENVDDTETT